jgi:selenocysteine-specific elongation factor
LRNCLNCNVRFNALRIEFSDETATMIVGTAGHIDHGKTTLVHALTGVDTDRLPEEKARGISIELGYAFLDIPGSPCAERIGFIDVPGHERLVHTMLAGVTGIDFALLLVAADDGVMPQTREHLAALSLLGLSRGAVVVTKIDRADESRIEEVIDEIDALLVNTSLAGVPVLRVSARTGAGVESLRVLLFEAARATPGQLAANIDGRVAFRLAIDRAFSLTGVGTVVTGTVYAGRVRVGDELALAPSSDALRARVRSLHAQNTGVAEAHAGQRCAVAIVGISKDQISRGQWLVTPSAAISTDRLDATVVLWHAESQALRSGARVHVHVGAVETTGTVAVLQVLSALEPLDSVRPGQRAHVQIVTREPIAAWRGDRVVLRDASATRTLAGGTVLDPFAPARYRRTSQRLAELGAWSRPNAAARRSALVGVCPNGISIRRLSLAEGFAESDPATPSAGCLFAGDAAQGDWLLGASHVDRLAESTIAALRAFHDEEPNTLGPEAARLRRLAAPRLPEPLWRALLARLQADGRLSIRGGFVHLPEHVLRLSETDERLSQRLAPLLADAGFEGSWARDLAQATGESEGLMRTTLARLARRGELHQVVKDLHYANRTIERLADIVRTLCDAQGGDLTAAQFRDATGLGRKRAIQILQYFDHVGMLRRVGDLHRIRSDTKLFFGASASVESTASAQCQGS